MGQCLLHNTPEAVHERLPWADPDGRFAFTAEARLDNRDEVFDALSVPGPERAAMADGALIRLAWERWGDGAPTRLLGDWSFAVWEPRERRLLLARDHHGNTALYYVADARRFAFASDRRALLALPDAPRRLNELYLAQVLTAWPEFHGPGTAYAEVCRVPPAHLIRLT